MTSIIFSSLPGGLRGPREPKTGTGQFPEKQENRGVTTRYVESGKSLLGDAAETPGEGFLSSHARGFRGTECGAGETELEARRFDGE